VILAGTGRTGSTWLGDLINHDNHFRVIFEPLAPSHVPLVNHFKWGQRLTPDCEDTKLTQPVHDILAGRVKSAWSDQYNRRFMARNRLIKFIRANLMLGWIRAHYPTIPIILLLRHPCAVAHSMLSLKRWQWNRDGFKDQPEIFDEILSPFREHVLRDMPLFERYVTNWCIEYYVPLKELRADQVYPVFYEDLCMDSALHLPPLLKYARGEFNPKVLETMNRPSRVAREGSAIHTGEDMALGWRNHVSDEQRATAREIMHRFGLQDLYDENDLPSQKTISQLLAKNA